MKTKTYNLKHVIVAVLLTALICISVTATYYAFGSPNGSETIIDFPSLAKGPSYVISMVDSTIYATNGLTGAIDYSGTNASTIWQQAIDATYSAGGGEVFGSTATYYITVPIQLKDGVDINGEGWQATEFDNDNTGAGFDKSVFRYEGTDWIYRGFRIENIGITGYGTDAPLISIDPDGSRVGRITLKNLWLHNAGDGVEGATDYSWGLYLSEIDEGDIIGVLLESNKDGGVQTVFSNSLGFYEVSCVSNEVGMIIKQGVGNSITSCAIEDNSYEGIMLWYSSLTEITGCFFEMNTNRDIRVLSSSYGFADQNVIENNYFTGTPTNIFLMSGGGNTVGRTKILSNWFNGDGTKGIHVNDANVTDTIIKYNYFSSYGEKVADSGSGTRFVEDDASGTATIANDEWVAHGLIGTPSKVTITTRTATYDGVVVIVSWVGQNSTHFQAGAYWANSTAITDDAINIAWYAEA